MSRFRAAAASGVFLAFFCGVIPLLADNPQPDGKTQPPGKTAEPAPIEEVQEVTAVETAARPAGLDLLGRMHPALVHFPIGWLVLLVLAEAAARFAGREEWGKVGLPLLVLVCLSFIPAALTGLLRAASMGNDPEFRALMVPHRNMNIAAGVLCLAALLLRLRRRNQSPVKPGWSYLLLVVAAAALVLVSGHLGGKMVFGSNYLPF